MGETGTQLLADLVARRRQIVQMIGAESQREAYASWQKGGVENAIFGHPIIAAGP